MEPLKAAWFSSLVFLVDVRSFFDPRHLHLVEPPIFLLLLGDVSPDQLRVSAYRIHEKAARPEGLARVVSLSLQEVPCHVDCTLALDVTHDAGHLQLRPLPDGTIFAGCDIERKAQNGIPVFILDRGNILEDRPVTSRRNGENRRRGEGEIDWLNGGRDIHGLQKLVWFRLPEQDPRNRSHREGMRCISRGVPRARFSNTVQRGPWSQMC